MALFSRLERHLRTDLRYLLYSGFWMNLGSIVITGGSFLLYLVFARTLTADTYGTYQYFLSLAAIAGAFTLTGMNTAVARAVSRGYEGSLRESIVVQLKWSAIPVIGCLVVAAYYALRGNLLFGLGMLLIGICIPLTNTFNTFSAYLHGKSNFRLAFWGTLVSNVLMFGSLILAALLGASAIVLLAVNLVVQLAVAYALYRAVIKIYRPADQTDPETIPYGKHMSLMGVLGMVAAHLDNVLIFQVLGPASLAVYSFATAIPERLAGFFKFIPVAALPRFSDRSVKEIRSTLVPKVFIMLGISMVVAALYAAAAPYIFAFFFPAYLASIPYSQLYSPIVISMVGSLLVTVFVSQQEIRKLYFFNTGVPLIQLAVQYGALLLWGLWGMIGAKLFSSVLVLIVAAWWLFGHKTKEIQTN